MLNSLRNGLFRADHPTISLLPGQCGALSIDTLNGQERRPQLHWTKGCHLIMIIIIMLQCMAYLKHYSLFYFILALEIQCNIVLTYKYFIRLLSGKKYSTRAFNYVCLIISQLNFFRSLLTNFARKRFNRLEEKS